MFGWLKKRDQAPSMRKPLAPCAPDKTIQIVGDVHGCIELMDRLMGKLDPSQSIVFVGDYVDRGVSSAEVLTSLKAKTEQSPETVVCLKGNHEVMMLEFLDDPTGRGRRWLEYGGLDTVLSYAIAANVSGMAAQDLIALRDTLQAKIGGEVIEWLRGLPTYFRSGNLVVTHAGMDPKLPLAQQNESALVWGRSRFLKDRREDDLWVAYGHNVYSVPVVRGGRIAVDTGAYHSGRLTAAVVQTNGEIDFVQVHSASPNA